VGVTKTLIRLQFGLKIKVKEAVPNCLTSKWTLIKEGLKVKEGPESESITIVVISGDERSTGSESTETETSSPVIKVYGSTGVEADASALETTEIGDRNSP